MLNVVSYGGGVQSNALLVLAAQGRLPARTFLFSNVGDDTEHPATLEYVRKTAMPYAQAHGIDLIELQKVRRDGRTETLLEYIHRQERSIPIPMKMAGGAPGRRKCTGEFKISVIDRWLREHGAKESGAIINLGISLDEFRRMKRGNGDAEKVGEFTHYPDPHDVPWKRVCYPLIDLWLKRDNCIRIITDAGLPVPPKSACWFCPMKSDKDWVELKRSDPELFDKSVALEAMLNERRATLGKDAMFMSNKKVVLPLAIQAAEENGADCESGYCMI